MKAKHNLIIIFLLVCGRLFGQASSGYIRYEEKIDQYKRLPPSAFNMVEQYSSAYYRLYFNPSESQYKGYIEDRPLPQQQIPGKRITMNTLNPFNHFYTKDDMTVMQVEFLGKYYLIDDTIKVTPWKFGSGTRSILGYECNQAYYIDSTNPERPLEITAWYTSKIRGFIGPERYNTLPGAILALDINNGDHYWVASKIELRDLTTDETIEPPPIKKNAKKATYDEYVTAQDEYMKQMRERMKY